MGVHKISALKPNHQSKCMMYFFCAQIPGIKGGQKKIRILFLD